MAALTVATLERSAPSLAFEYTSLTVDDRDTAEPDVCAVLYILAPNGLVSTRLTKQDASQLISVLIKAIWEG